MADGLHERATACRASSDGGGGEEEVVVVQDEFQDLTFKVDGRELVVRINVGGNSGREDGEVDANFFDPSYSIEAFTGFAVWDACWVLVEMMKQGLGPAAGEGLRGCRVVELGAGTGIVALAAAVLGAEVTATDLASVVEGSLAPNLWRNRESPSPGRASGAEETAADTAPETSRRQGDFFAEVGQHGGRCTARPLDWYEDAVGQLAGADGQPLAVDVVLAADTVWLKDLVDPFARTMAGLLHCPTRPTGFMAFYERSSAASTVFARPEDVLDALARHGCDVERLDTAFMERPAALPLHLLQITASSGT